MIRRLFSLVVVLVAAFTAVFAGSVAEAQDWQLNPVQQQYGAQPQQEYDTGYNGLTCGKPWGEGPLAAKYIQRHGNCRCGSAYAVRRFHGLITTVGVR